MNQVALIGNLTKDPELRTTPSGASVCSIRLAVNNKRKDANGDWVEEPYFFNVTAWNAQADNCAKYLSKGKKIAVTGKLTWREWEADDGSKRQAVDVLAFNVEFLTPKDDSSSGGSSGGGTYADEPNVSGSADDDIPF